MAIHPFFSAGGWGFEKNDREQHTSDHDYVVSIRMRCDKLLSAEPHTTFVQIGSSVVTGENGDFTH